MRKQKMIFDLLNDALKCLWLGKGRNTAIASAGCSQLCVRRRRDWNYCRSVESFAYPLIDTSNSTI